MYQEALKNQVKVQKSLETRQKKLPLGHFQSLVNGLSCSERKVLYHLMGYGRCKFITLKGETIAHKLGVSRRTVTRVLRILRDRNLIRRKRHFKRANDYYLHDALKGAQVSFDAWFKNLSSYQQTMYMAHDYVVQDKPSKTCLSEYVPTYLNIYLRESYITNRSVIGSDVRLTIERGSRSRTRFSTRSLQHLPSFGVKESATSPQRGNLRAVSHRSKHNFRSKGLELNKEALKKLVNFISDERFLVYKNIATILELDARDVANLFAFPMAVVNEAFGRVRGKKVANRGAYFMRVARSICSESGVTPDKDRLKELAQYCGFEAFPTGTPLFALSPEEKEKQRKEQDAQQQRLKGAEHKEKELNRMRQQLQDCHNTGQPGAASYFEDHIQRVQNDRPFKSNFKAERENRRTWPKEPSLEFLEQELKNYTQAYDHQKKIYADRLTNPIIAAALKLGEAKIEQICAMIQQLHDGRPSGSPSTTLGEPEYACQSAADESSGSLYEPITRRNNETVDDLLDDECQFDLFQA